MNEGVPRWDVDFAFLQGSTAGDFRLQHQDSPIHPSLRTALAPWRKMTTGTGPVIRSERGGPMTPVSIVNWFAIANRAVGLEPEATPASGGVRCLGSTFGASASAPIRRS